MTSKFQVSSFKSQVRAVSSQQSAFSRGGFAPERKSGCVAAIAVAACLLVLLLFVAGGAVAQEGGERASAPRYTLAQLETEALENNPELKVAAARVALVQAQVPLAGALDDPMASVRAWGVPLKQPWNPNQAQTMFMFEQALPGRGKRALRTAVARAGATVTEATLEARRRDVLLEVRRAYYELLRNADDHRVHAEQLVIARQAVDSSRIKYTVGRGPLQDVVKAQIVMTRLAEHLIELEEQQEMARAALNTLLGRAADAALEVSGAYATVTELPGPARLEQMAVEARPELAALRAGVEQEKLRTQLAEREAQTPDFAVGGGYMVMPAGSMARNTYQAEVRMTLPWLNKKRHAAEVAEAQAGVAMGNAELAAKRNEIRREIQEALIKAKTAARKLELYRNTLRPQAEAGLKAANAAYQADRTDLLNLVDSQNVLLEVQSSYYRALAEYDGRVAELERAIGAPLPRNDEVRAEVR